MTLVRATYKRIRTVQAYLGFDLLLPMPQNQEANGDEARCPTWTQHEALNAIIRETSDLLEEFEVSEHSLDDDIALTDHSGL